MTTSYVPPLPPLSQVEEPVNQIDTEGVTTSLGIQESGGDYKARNDDAYGPENPALGKYQTLKTTAWEVLQRNGRPLPTDINEYLNSPQKQEEVMKLLMQEAIDQAQKSVPHDHPNRQEHIIRKIAAIHYGGPGNMENYMDREPQAGGYPSFYDYGSKIWNNYKAGGTMGGY